MNKPTFNFDNTPIEELSYEQAIAQLDIAVAALESGEHNLDAALAIFERSQLLIRRCAKLLDSAELRVMTLQEEGLADFEE